MENNEENRNSMCNTCNEQDNCTYVPQGINAAFGYNTAQALKDDLNCCNSCNPEQCMQNRNRAREEMMKQIKCLSFAIVDISECRSDDKSSFQLLVLKFKLFNP